MQQDFVIYCPEFGSYATYVDDCEFGGWSFGSVLEANGWNCSQAAQGMITGRLLPSGRVLCEAVPQFKNCVVRKRTIMVEVEDV